MLLAVDSSTQFIGLALYDGAQVIGESIWHTPGHHTVELAPAIKILLEKSAVKIEGLQALGIALGPGSFTGLRIGLALVKGMALAHHLSVIGVPTLDFLAAAQPVQDRQLAAVLQAGRNRLALAFYEPTQSGWRKIGEPKVTTVDDLVAQIKKPTLICGEMNAEERHVLARKWKNVVLASPAQCVRRPSFLAEMAWQRFETGNVDDPVSLAPIYLHVAGEIPS
jgi:tRNA threonylcarbamoyladenosine biosynthesis protein TsaB